MNESACKTLDSFSRRRFIQSGAGAAAAVTGLVTWQAFGKTFEYPVRASHTDEGKYVCPPCGQPCDQLTFDKAGNCPQCGMKLIPLGEAKDGPARVSVLLFNSVEIIDFAGPWEVFGGAGYRVFSVAEKAEPVTTVYGQKITADYTFETSPKADILLVPGGGVRDAVANEKLIKWVQDNARSATYVMSVCTGAFILAKAGLLDGLSATTVRGGIDRLATAGTNIKAVYDKRYVDNGKIITTAGLSSGIDGALHLVSRMQGKGQAQQVALSIEYNWDPEAKFARAAFADRYLPNFQGIDADIQSTEGDAERWEVRALVTKPASAAEIMELIKKQVVSDTPHRSSAVVFTPRTAKSPDSSESEWKFADDRGRNWRGWCLAETSEVKGRFNVTVRLTRSA